MSLNRIRPGEEGLGWSLFTTHYRSRVVSPNHAQARVCILALEQHESNGRAEHVHEILAVCANRMGRPRRARTSVVAR
jgi:hypothetical protein